MDGAHFTSEKKALNGIVLFFTPTASHPFAAHCSTVIRCLVVFVKNTVPFMGRPATP